MTARALNNLGVVYCNMGRLDEAQPYLNRALAIRTRALGQNRPETAQTMSNLGYLFAAQGRQSKARTLCQQALTIREQMTLPRKSGH
jgi:Tfp pilus assembly protein PilF